MTRPGRFGTRGTSDRCAHIVTGYDKAHCAPRNQRRRLIITKQHEVDLAVPTILRFATSKFVPIMVRDCWETIDVAEELVKFEFVNLPLHTVVLVWECCDQTYLTGLRWRSYARR